MDGLRDASGALKFGFPFDGKFGATFGLAIGVTIGVTFWLTIFTFGAKLEVPATSGAIDIRLLGDFKIASEG